MAFFVPLQYQYPPSLSTMLKCAGRFIFYTFLLLRFSYFQNDSYFFVNIENMGENGNVLIIAIISVKKQRFTPILIIFCYLCPKITI